MDKQIEQTMENEKKKQREHKFSLVGVNDVECTNCGIKHGGLLNPGREELREDGHIYAIRDFDKFKKGDKIL